MSDWFEFFWFVIALLYRKPAMFGLSFLDPKDLCLPNQFSRRSWQKRSISTYLMSKKKLGSFNDWFKAYFEPFICLSLHDMNIFWPASFSKFPWCFWKKFNDNWNNLRKTLRSYGNLRSLADLSGTNIGFHSNSRNWLFWVFMIDVKNQSINEQKCAVFVRCVNSILYKK